MPVVRIKITRYISMLLQWKR